MIYTVENTKDRGDPVFVKLNGKRIKYTFYADTKKGIVRYYAHPLRINKKKNGAIWFQRRGKVEVFPAPRKVHV